MRIFPPAIHSPQSPFVHHAKSAPYVLSRRLATDVREQLFHEEFFPPQTDELMPIFDIKKSGRLPLLPSSNDMDANELDDFPHDIAGLASRPIPDVLLDAKTTNFLTHYHIVNMELDRLPSRRQFNVH